MNVQTQCTTSNTELLSYCGDVSTLSLHLCLENMLHSILNTARIDLRCFLTLVCPLCSVLPTTHVPTALAYWKLPFELR